MRNLKIPKSIKLLSLVMAAVFFTTGVCYAAVNRQTQSNAKSLSLYEKALKDHGFVYGINYYSVPGGLGDTQATGAKCSFDESLLRCGLYNIKQIGFDATQIWLFFRTCGLEYTADGDIIGVQDIFLKNLKTTCEIARETGISLSFTIQPHFDYTLESGLYFGSKLTYDKYTRFVTDKSVRKNYIEKAVKPVLNVLKNYTDVVFAITAYCEPEGDIYGKENGYKPWGTTIDVMTEFIQSIVDASREYLPNVPVSVACGWNYANSVRYFNKLGLDYIGMNIYDDQSRVQDLSKFIITSPVMLTEFGPKEKLNSSNSYFHITNFQNFIANAKMGGYTGAFYWCYSGKGTMQSFLGSTDYDYLPLAAAAHFTIVDDKNMSAGKEDEKDTPVMLWPDKDGTIRFIASRTAASYYFERSKDGKTWQNAGSIDADEADKNGTFICSFTDQGAEQGAYYYYRVTSIDEDGSRHTSDVSSRVKTMKTTCSESENLVPDYSFEKTNVVKDSFDWCVDNTGEHFSIVEKTDEEPDIVHSGNRAFRIEGNNDWSWAGKKVTGLTPNTKYVYTFYAYADGDGSIHAKVLDSNRREISRFNISSAYQNQWVRYTYIVDIGDNDSVILGFSDVGGTFNFDDLYFFPYLEE